MPGRAYPRTSAAARRPDLLRPPLQAQLRAGEQGIADIALRDAGKRQLDRAAAGLGHCHQGALARQQIDQHTCRAVLEQQHARQGELADPIERLAHQSGAEAGTFDRPDRQFRAQLAVSKRQTGGERLGRGRALQQPGQDDQATKQGIIQAPARRSPRPGLDQATAGGTGPFRNARTGRRRRRVRASGLPLGLRSFRLGSGWRGRTDVLFGLSQGSRHGSRALGCRFRTPRDFQLQIEASCASLARSSAIQRCSAAAAVPIGRQRPRCARRRLP